MCVADRTPINSRTSTPLSKFCRNGFKLCERYICNACYFVTWLSSGQHLYLEQRVGCIAFLYLKNEGNVPQVPLAITI